MRKTSIGELTLFMFPFVGANRYSYAKIANELRCKVVVYELPGRGIRIGEPLLHTFEEVLDDAERFYNKEIELVEDCAFFGHSMGGLIAFSLYQRLLNKKKKTPSRLILSSCSLSHNFNDNKLSLMNSVDFWQRLREFGGVSKESFESEEFRTFWEPIFKADYACLETRVEKLDSQVPVAPLILYGSKEVVNMLRQDWKNSLSNNVMFQEINGGHFYWLENASTVVKLIEKHLTNTIKDKTNLLLNRIVFWKGTTKNTQNNQK